MQATWITFVIFCRSLNSRYNNILLLPMLTSRTPKASPVLLRSGTTMWFSPQTEAKTTSELSVHLKRKSLKPKPNKHKDIKQQPVHNIPPKRTESSSLVPTTLQPHQPLLLFRLPGPLHPLSSQGSLPQLLIGKPSQTPQSKIAASESRSTLILCLIVFTIYLSLSEGICFLFKYCPIHIG